MDVHVEYLFFTNEHQLGRVKEIVPHLLHHLPFWVAELKIKHCGHGDDDGATLAICELNPSYRWMVIKIFDAMFDQPDWRIKASFLHEIYHSTIGEFTEWAREELLIPIKTSNTDLYNALNREFTRRVEYVVQGLVLDRSGQTIVREIP